MWAYVPEPAKLTRDEKEEIIKQTTEILNKANGLKEYL